MKRLFKEPLVHFLLFGGVVFLYYQSVAPKENSQIQKKAITFTKYDIKESQNDFYRKTHRQPTQKELDLLVQNAFLQDVLLSEAYALGLEKEDATIKKRLLEKMELLLNQKQPKEPSETELKNYYRKHLEDYSQKEHLSFLLMQIPSQEHLQELQTSLWLLPPKKLPAKSFRNLTPKEIEEQLGKLARQKILSLPKGVWSEPIYTKEGNALVFITAYDKLSKPLPFERVEYRVYNDYLRFKRQKNKKEKLQKILKRYELRYED